MQISLTFHQKSAIKTQKSRHKVHTRLQYDTTGAMRRRERKEKIVAENTAHKTISQIATEKIVEIVNGPKPLMFSTDLVKYALLLRVEGTETLSKREEEYADSSAYHSFDPLFKDFQHYVFTRCCHYDGAPTEDLRISCTKVFRDIHSRIANELSCMFCPVQ